MFSIKSFLIVTFSIHTARLVVSSETQKILQSDVKALVLKSGEMTTGRRFSPLPQLTCVSGCTHQVDEVLCKNMGTDGQTILWDCESNLPEQVKFSHSEVSCEGYDDASDPFILVGSCQFRYGLSSGRTGESANVGTDSNVFLFLLVGFMIYYFCSGQKTDHKLSRQHVPVATPVVNTGHAAPPTGPGFWSGLGLGAIGGAALGRGSRRRSNYTSWSRPSSSRSNRSSSRSKGFTSRTFARTKNR